MKKPAIIITETTPTPATPGLHISRYYADAWNPLDYIYLGTTLTP